MGKKLKKPPVPVGREWPPTDYPFGDKMSESLAEYAARTGKPVGTVRWQADTGRLPIVQPRPGAKREVNLYAIYLNTRYKAERYVEMMN